MAFDPELVKSVQNEALALTEAEVVSQPPMPVEIYTSELSGYLGQMAKDSAKWIDTGYDYENKKPRGDLLLNMIVDAQAIVVTNRKILESAPQRWNDERGNVETERRRLLAADRIVYSGDSAGEASIKEISTDSSNAGMVMGILSLIKMAIIKIDMISKIKIDKVTIDKTYLDKTKAWAEDLISILGIANSYRSGKAPEIDYRNRIVTLCQKFIDDLKTWTPAIYFNDPETLAKFTSSYYSSNKSSSGGNDNTKQNPPASKGPSKGKGKGPSKGSNNDSGEGSNESDNTPKEELEEQTADA